MNHSLPDPPDLLSPSRRTGIWGASIPIMKTPILLTLSAAALMVVPAFGEAPAQEPKEVIARARSADDPGPFLGVEIEGSNLQNVSVNAGSIGVDFKFKSQMGYTIPVGYQFANGLSASLSFGRYHSKFDGLTGNVGGQSQSAAVSGGLTSIPVMANAAYKVKLGSGFNWELGGGVGAVYENTTFQSFDDPTDRSITFGQLGKTKILLEGLKNSEWAFGFQAFTGVSYDVLPSASLNFGVRYLQTGSNLSVNGVSSENLSAYSVGLGLIWKL